MRTLATILQKFIQFGPMVLKLAAYFLAMVAGNQVTGIATGAYGDTWGNWLTNAVTWGGAAVSWLLSYAIPRSMPTIEKWLNAILAEARKRLAIDPKNESDVDERFFAVLSEFLLAALALWLKKIGTDPDEAASIVAELRVKKVVAETGVPASALLLAMKDSAAAASKV